MTLDRDRLDPDEVVERHGIRCTRVSRALFDAMRRAPDLREAVVAMDMAAVAALTSVNRQRGYVAGHTGWTGVARARQALELATEHSRSPNESRMRLVWLLDAGLPRPRMNQPVLDHSGRLLGIADLLDVEAGVVGEFDGADHRYARRHASDVAREERFRGVGLEVFHVTGPDLAAPDLVVARMLATRDRARWLPGPERAWILPASDDWTLDERLDHRDWVAACHAAWDRP